MIGGVKKNAKMGDQASSTITDLRQLMMRGELDNLVGGSVADRESNAAAAERPE